MTGIKGMKGSGGSRKGAGRKMKYGEETVNLTTRVPKSKLSEFKKAVAAILKKWEVKQ